MDDSKEIRTMRYMEWERVKGGIKAILSSIWNDLDDFSKAKETAEKFMLEFGEAAHLD